MLARLIVQGRFSAWLGLVLLIVGFVAFHEFVDFVDFVLHELLVLLIHDLYHFVLSRRISLFFLLGGIGQPFGFAAPVENEIILHLALLDRFQHPELYLQVVYVLINLGILQQCQNLYQLLTFALAMLLSEVPLHQQDLMEISRVLHPQFLPRQTPLNQIYQRVNKRLKIVTWTLLLPLMSSATHKTQGAHSFPLFFLRNILADGQSQSEIEDVDNFVFLSQSYRQVIGLNVSVQVADFVECFESIDYLQADHEYSFEGEALFWSYLFELVEIFADKFHEEIFVLHEFSSLIVLHKPIGELLLLHQRIHLLLNLSVPKPLSRNHFDSVLLLLVSEIQSQVHRTKTPRLEFAIYLPPIVDGFLD